MPIRREFPPRSLNAEALIEGRVDPQYTKVLLRLLAAHAMAEKLTALGYQRARLIYDALEELGMSQQAADRSMIAVLKAPSFDAPSYFASKAEGELDLLMASLSLDTTGLIMIGENYRESSYVRHARAAEIILAQGADHEIFASRQLGDAVDRFGAKSVNTALRRWMPRAGNFFGPPGTGFTYACIA